MMRALVRLGSAVAVVGTAHSIYNLRLLRVSPADPAPVEERVALLLPVRNEAKRVEPCLRSLLAQRDVPDLQIVVLDDGSDDETAEVVRRVAGGDVRLCLVQGSPQPRSVWGKPQACQQLAEVALGADVRATVLVFVDADVVLEPQAVAAAVTLLRGISLELISPYPRQLAVTVGERLVQPLLQWSWLTTLPLGLAERSGRPSLSAANGQFLVVDAAAYERCGGHAAVSNEMLEDIGLLRTIKRSGGRGVVVDGTTLATCRMYDAWASLQAGYAKSLWSAFGSPVGAAGALAFLVTTYVLPPVAALRGSRAGLVGYGAAVVGRAVVARRVKARVLPDVLAHPASICALGWLTFVSFARRRSQPITGATDG